MIRKLIDERSYRKEQTIQEVTQKWGGNQTLTGPVIQVPYERIHKYTNGKSSLETHYFYIFPSNLEINGEVITKLKYRSIYEVLIYNTDLLIKGNFIPEDFVGWPERFNKINWHDSRIILGIADLRGITNTPTLSWNNSNLRKLTPGTSECRFLGSGINAKTKLLSESVNSFEIKLKLNGSGKLYFAPVANQSVFSLKSNWGDPSFDGAILPGNSNITDTSFTAIWKTTEMIRTFPQILSSESNHSHLNFQESGVELILPVKTYQKSTRSVKYAFLFIALTFLVMFFGEITSSRRIHPIQYLIVGLALVIFYSLLMALAEHISFNLAYLIGSITIVLMNTIYIHSIFKFLKNTIVVGLAMIALYTYLFTILQVAEYALLIGNIGLVIILGIVMIFSRKVDWYGTQKVKSDTNESF
jgi:inner membrane protein